LQIEILKKKVGIKSVTTKILALLTILGLALVTEFLRNLARRVTEPATHHKPQEKKGKSFMFSDAQVTFSARKESSTFKTILAQSYGL